MRFLDEPKSFALAAVVFIVLVTGCTQGEIDPRPGTGHIGLDVGYHENTNFVVNGTIYFDLAVESGVQFPRVMACAYDRRGNLLSSTEVGTFVTPTDSADVHMELNQRPRYIIIDQPKFSDYPEFDPGVVILTEESIRETGGNPEDIVDEFEYRRPSVPGVCQNQEG